MEYKRKTTKISINWKFAFLGLAIAYIITILSLTGKL